MDKQEFKKMYLECTQQLLLEKRVFGLNKLIQLQETQQHLPSVLVPLLQSCYSPLFEKFKENAISLLLEGKLNFYFSLAESDCKLPKDGEVFLHTHYSGGMFARTYKVEVNFDNLAQMLKSIDCW